MTMDASAVSGEVPGFGGWSAYCAAARMLMQSTPAQADQPKFECQRRASDADRGRK